ncbi:MAG: sigma-E processing peptidase SpoIIGA [Clostridia bacterium]|nr:sigma-E processing peptidase SpoIIGA [Clostridia bacterium]
MVVYIEYVILDNFVFTYLIANLSYRIVREKPKILRCIIASIVGTACAVFYPFVKDAVVVIIIKISLLSVMSFILYIKLPKFFVRVGAFLVCTAVFGGIQFMLGYLVYGDAQSALSLPISDLPLSVFFLTPIGLWLVARRLFAIINSYRIRKNYIYDLKLSSGENSVMIKGLIDTGNTVKDSKSVIFINAITAIELFGIDYLTLRNKDNSFINVLTATGKKEINLFPAKIELYLAKDEHIFMDVQVGISNVCLGAEYQAILPLSVLEKEKIL